MKSGKLNRGYNLEPATLERIEAVAEQRGCTLGEAVDVMIAHYMRDGLPIFAQLGGTDNLWVMLTQPLSGTFTGTVIVEYVEGDRRIAFYVKVTEADNQAIIDKIYANLPEYERLVKQLRQKS